MSAKEANLAAPDGFRYEVEVVPPDEERALVGAIREVPLKEFDFHGYIAKRRVKSFGWGYDFETEELTPADPIRRSSCLSGSSPPASRASRPRS